MNQRTEGMDRTIRVHGCPHCGELFDCTTSEYGRHNEEFLVAYTAWLMEQRFFPEGHSHRRIVQAFLRPTS